jgi:UDP-GlcNAc:undecaprenyl-phosphate/decaprenyl-phosphate GlcNAc-1-phosphate transferase
MLWLCLALILVGLIVATPATWAARALGRRLGALDAPGVAGQVKAPLRRIPNTGGIGLFLGLALPMLAILALPALVDLAPHLLKWAPDFDSVQSNFNAQRTSGFILLACVLVLHLVGVVDDRRPLGAYVKLVLMVALAVMFTFLDAPLGGAWASIALTVLWVCVITNAFNFLDNMDGLSAGLGLITAAFFLVIALMGKQWFVGATLALLIGAAAGFLVFNFPWTKRRKLTSGESVGGASVFMGDGGSLVVGFVIAVLSVRITYVLPSLPGAASTPAGLPWHAVLMPLLILAVPLYDFCSVVAIRLRQGRSPLVGDLQHFSHRLVRHGLSQRDSVLVIYGCAMITGIGAIMLPRLELWQAVLVGVQTVLVLLVIALYEFAREPVAGEQHRGQK